MFIDHEIKPLETIAFMEPVTATALEIKYFSGALSPAEDFGVCKTFISAKGVIRTTFQRNMKYSDQFDFGSNHLMPVSVTYEYKLKNNSAAAIFEDFDLLELKPSESDLPADDGGSWQMTVYTNGMNSKYGEG
ncbi:hypothetical protein [Pelotomaculum propionicicum]|uniref:Uncharacterized protein n=1 Tax=Pelotomaculum propionicicum TaxID=258475 RepID=A0A4Y7RKL1_9FIRM|nr:hypothetical protein [Pelotomaculum propionicicum]TEB08857.1 hypothetical protein Pmgp_03590 [Pelotomaculum propionicicum]